MKIFNDIYVTFYCEIVENKFEIYRKSLPGKYIFINQYRCLYDYANCGIIEKHVVERIIKTMISYRLLHYGRPC